MRLTDRELATVLAALRHWQEHIRDHRIENSGYDFFYADDGIDRSPLVPTEIDDLVERLNTTENDERLHATTTLYLVRLYRKNTEEHLCAFYATAPGEALTMAERQGHDYDEAEVLDATGAQLAVFNGNEPSDV